MPTRLQDEIKQTRPFRSPGQEATLGLLRTADRVRRRLGTVVARHGITLSQYNVLRILRGAGPDGLCTSEVAGRLIEQTPGVTRMMDRLEARGWVERERQKGDRRMVRCRLTASGRGLVDQLDEPVNSADAAIVAGLSLAETGELIRLLDRVREPLD